MGTPRPSAAPRGDKADTTSRTTLDRGRIVAAALEMIDEDGLDKLSMRRLAAALGVEAMSLYNHVSDKSDLLSGVADAVLAGVRTPRSGTWQQRVIRVLTELRRVSQAHPNAFPLVVADGVLTPAALEPADAVLGALTEAGLAESRRVQTFWMLISYTIGSISCQLMSDDAAADPPGISPVSATSGDPSLPHLAEVADRLFACDLDADFTAGLELLLGAIEADRPS